MQRVVEELVAGRKLDDAAEIHDCDALAQMPHHRQIVSDKQIGQAEPLAEILQEVDDLSLDRNIERGDRLVTDDEFRLQGEGTGDPDPLALAAGHFMRVTVGEFRIEAANR